MYHDCDRAAASATSPVDPEETPVEFIVGYAVRMHVGTNVSVADGVFGVGVDSSVVGIAVGDDVGRKDLGIRGFGSGLGLGFAAGLGGSAWAGAGRGLGEEEEEGARRRSLVPAGAGS